MSRWTVAAWLVLAALLPAAGSALPRAPEPRPDPRAVSGLPSYVQRVAPAIIGLRVEADRTAPSSARLGRQRFASAVLFDPRGYALTVSYALIDAVRVEARLRDGRSVAARVAGLDLEHGLGVVRLEGPGPWPVAVLGDSRAATPGMLTGTVGVDEDDDLVHVTGTLRSIERFAGYWEYMLDRALMVAPASRAWSGNVVVDASGAVIGVASLRLGEGPHVNLAIPIEVFTSTREELLGAGRVLSRPPRPWLGVYTVAGPDGLVVESFSPVGPAAQAGLRPGDRIVAVNGVGVASREEFYTQLWRGQAGDDVHVAVRREGEVHVIRVRSIDRYRLLRPPSP